MKRKSETLRQQIIEATTDLIITSGIAATSTVKVAQLVKTSQSNLYKYFNNRQALLLAVFEYHQQLLFPAESELPTAATFDQLVSFCRQEIAFADANPRTIQVIAAFRAQPELHAQLPAIAANPVLQSLFAALQREQAAGVIKSLPGEFLAEGVFAIIVNYTTAKLAHEPYLNALSQADVLQLIEDLVRTH